MTSESRNRSASPGATSTLSALGWGIGFHAVVAVVLYFLDAVVLSQGAISAVVTVAMLAWAVVQVVRGAVGKRGLIWRGIATASIYISMSILVFITITVNNRMARVRADRIVAALRVYKAKHGSYPAQLADLVPEELPSVPLAKYTLLFNQFSYRYWPADGTGFLHYKTFPPVGPRFDLRTEAWSRAGY